MSEPLTVFSRQGCHLCDVLIDELRLAVAGHSVSITVVDIDTDPALAARYGERVPVLVAGGEEVCQFRLDHRRVAALLAGG